VTGILVRPLGALAIGVWQGPLHLHLETEGTDDCRPGC